MYYTLSFAIKVWTPTRLKLCRRFQLVQSQLAAVGRFLKPATVDPCLGDLGNIALEMRIFISPVRVDDVLV